MTERATLSLKVKDLLLKYNSPDAISAINEVLEIIKHEDYVIERRSPIKKSFRYSMKVSKAQSELIQLVRERSVCMQVDCSIFSEQKVIRCQKIVRKFLFRHRGKKIGQIIKAMPECKAQRKRNEVWRELLSTEQTYVNYLQALDKNYFQPIKDAVGTDHQILPRVDFVTVFSKVFQSILSFNAELLNVLNDYERSWPSSKSIGNIFLQRAPFIKIYASYVNNFNQSYIVRQKHKNNKVWNDFCSEAQKLLKGKTLPDLLIMPIQRVPRYQILLRELLKNTCAQHFDYMNIKNALVAIESITTELEESKKEAENLQKIVVISDRLTGENIPDLVIPGRRYIREGTLYKGTSKKKKYIYLLSDMILVTNSFVYCGVYYLIDIAIVDIDSSTSFWLYDGKKRSKFTAKTEGEKTGWMWDINATIESFKASNAAKSPRKEKEKANTFGRKSFKRASFTNMTKILHSP